MSAPRWSIAALAALAGATLAQGSTQRPRGPAVITSSADITAIPARAAADPSPPPPALEALGAAPPDVSARIERLPNGGGRLVVSRAGAFVHLAFGDVAGGGPDWAALTLARAAGDAAGGPDARDAGEARAVWESTSPSTLETQRGIVTFRLDTKEASASVALAAPPAEGPSRTTLQYNCKSISDAISGQALVCRFGGGAGAVHAAALTAERPRDRAWTWETRASGGGGRLSFVRIDLPARPGGAAAGAIGFVQGNVGVVVRADAVWPSAAEPPTLVIDEMSRPQPSAAF